MQLRINKFLYFALALLSAPGLATFFAYALTFNTSDFEGARGFAIIGIVPIFTLIIGAINCMARSWLNGKSVILQNLLIAVFVISTLGFWIPMGGMASILWFKPAFQKFNENLAKEKSVTLNAKKISDDYAKQAWIGALPLCVNTADEDVLKNECVKPIYFEYCWQITPSGEWEALDYACTQDRWFSKTLTIGKNHLLPKPWQRSYYPDKAELKIRCSKISKTDDSNSVNDCLSN